MEWSQQNFPGHCPSPRRRQCACVVNSKVYFFGGTSPKTPEKISDEEESALVDRSDLYILDFGELAYKMYLWVIHFWWVVE